MCIIMSDCRSCCPGPYTTKSDLKKKMGPPRRMNRTDRRLIRAILSNQITQYYAYIQNIYELLKRMKENGIQQ
jgi:hypothetical protein